MPDVNDTALTREYADRGSETAFAELVHRHINLVYSVALRYTGNSPDAQDVTQAVFIILAQKAASLRQRTTLTGWLYETTRFTARQVLRTRNRQQAREQEAYMESTLNDSNTENLWRQLAPILEDAMSRLNEKERTLLALRFYENKSGAETAALLGIQEWAAHKRATRALEKLRKYFFKHGVTSTAATLGETISANSVQAAPALLAKTATAVALAKGATASLSTLTLIQEALKMMARQKIKTTITIGAVVIMTGGFVAAVVSGHQIKPAPLDAVAFFKQAISSPPDVGSFIAGQRNLKPLEDLVQAAQMFSRLRDADGKTNSDEILQEAKRMQQEQFYTGARAGSNYYFRSISGPTKPNIPGDDPSIFGRDGSLFYQVGANNFSYGSGTNSFVASIDTMSGLMRQLLDMGLGEVKPESVAWSGNQFSALNRFGNPEYGVLEVSNNLPFALAISRQKNSPIYKRIEYQYPNPPASLGGFPAKIKIFDVSGDDSKPSLEITLYSIHIANAPLPDKFFNPDQFKTAKTIYTNAYINSEVWGVFKPVRGEPYFTNVSKLKIVFPKN